MKVSIIGCGLMGSGIASLVSADAEMLMIDLDEEKAASLAAAYGGLFSRELSAVHESDVICVVLPAPAITDTFLSLTEYVKPDAIVIDMATTGIIPQEAKRIRPDVNFIEAGIIGSGLAVSYGMKAMLVVETDNDEMLDRIRLALPGFRYVMTGDPLLVPVINSKGAYYGIRAAVETERALHKMGLSEEWVKCASGCLVPGSVLGYSEGKMGKFNRNIADKILQELSEEPEK